jgi:GT2 family glycosyltransferase
LDPNRGVPGGYNAAIRHAHDLGAEYVLLLNNDTMVSDTHLVESLVADASERVAAVGPQILHRDGRVFSFGGMLNYWTGVTRHRKTRSGAEAYDVPWIESSCILVRLDAACELGGFHEVYWSTWDETDWCVRATRAGWRVLIEPRTSVTHFGGATVPSGMQSPFGLRNGILFIRRNGNPLQNLTSIACLVVGMVPLQIALALRVHRPVSGVLGQAFHALVWNVKDAIRRRHWRLVADGPSVCDAGR